MGKHSFFKSGRLLQGKGNLGLLKPFFLFGTPIYFTSFYMKQWCFFKLFPTPLAQITVSVTQSWKSTVANKPYGGSHSKESTCNAADPGLIPESKRSAGEGNGNPRQYSSLQNSMDRGTWQATVRGVTKSQIQLST